MTTCEAGRSLGPEGEGGWRVSRRGRLYLFYWYERGSQVLVFGGVFCGGFTFLMQIHGLWTALLFPTLTPSLCVPSQSGSQAH